MSTFSFFAKRTGQQAALMRFAQWGYAPNPTSLLYMMAVATKFVKIHTKGV